MDHSNTSRSSIHTYGLLTSDNHRDGPGWRMGPGLQRMEALQPKVSSLHLLQEFGTLASVQDQYLVMEPYGSFQQMLQLYPFKLYQNRRHTNLEMCIV